MDQINNPKTLNVLFIAAEADPLIKVGGLGDVAYALPKALKDLSSNNLIDNTRIDIRVAIPCHANVNQKISNASMVASFSIQYLENEIPVNVYQTLVGDIPFYLFSGAPLIPTDSPVYSGNNRIDALKYFFFSL